MSPHRQHSMHEDPPRDLEPVLQRARWVFGAFALIALAFLVAEHRAHVLGALPYLILLACPLLHVFMHRGHSGHGGYGARDGYERK